MYREVRPEGPRLTQEASTGLSRQVSTVPTHFCACPTSFLCHGLESPNGSQHKGTRKEKRAWLSASLVTVSWLRVGSNSVFVSTVPAERAHCVIQHVRESVSPAGCVCGGCPSYTYFCTLTNKAISNRIWGSRWPCTADRHVMPVLQGTSLKSPLWLPQAWTYLV